MKRLIFYLICMLCSMIVQAQYYPYKRYTTEQGLSQIQVVCIYRDVKGFLWIGTKNGLNRFNGKDFLVFGSDQGIMSKQILNICGDANGRVFVQTAIDLGYIEHKTYHKIELPNLTSILLGATLHCDQNNRLWLFNGHYLYRYQVETKQLDSIRFSSKDYPVISGMYEDNNHLYFACEGGLYQVHTQSLTTSNLLRIDSTTNYLYPVPGQQKLLLGTSTTVHSYDLKSNSLQLIYKNPKIHIEQLMVDNYGHILIKPSLQPYISIDGSTTYFDPQFFSVNVAMVDTVDKLLFMGTEKGLVQIFQNGIIEYNPSNSKMHEEIWNIYEDHNKAVWFHSYAYGVNKLSNGTLSDVTLNMPDNCRRHAYFQSVRYNNKVFVNYGKGVAVNDGKNLSFCVPDTSYLAICSIYDSATQKILIGSHSALLSLDPKTYTLQTEFYDQDYHRPILSICPLKNQRYLLTCGIGYYIFSMKTHQARRHFATENKSPFRGAVATLRDKQGRIWIGSNDGLFQFDEQTDQMHAVDGLDKKTITSLIELDDKRLLIGMETKLIIFDKAAYLQGKKNVAYTFDFKNGFLGIETGQNGFFKDSKGHIWIPSSNKVLRLMPEYLFMDTRIKQTHIDNMMVGSEIDQWFAQTLSSAHRFDYPLRHVKFEFQPSSLINDNKITYQYRLKTDAAWSDWTSQTSVSFYHLPPGDYSFQVRSNHMGVISAQATTLRFTLVPRWFEILPVQAVLVIGSVLFLFSIGMFIYINRKNQAMRFQREKNALELDILRQQLNPHFLRNTLKSFQRKILTMSEENKFEVADNVSELSRLFSLYLESSVNKYITLDDEIRLLTYYLDFQLMRFKQRFQYSITKDPALKGDLKLIPMIIQPFVENATEKAFAGIDYTGKLDITFTSVDAHSFQVCIRDNGIGRQKANLQKTSHISRSSEIIEKINRLYNETYAKSGSHFHYQVSDLFDTQHQAAGTKVDIIFPIQPHPSL
jgi:ligand-binding sensor domain-containing protein